MINCLYRNIFCLLPALLTAAHGLDTDLETIATAEAGSFDTISFGAESPLFKQGIQLYRQGLSAYMSGDYAGALASFERVLRLDPLHEECLMLLNRAKAKLGIREIKSDKAGDSARALMQRQIELYNAGMKSFAAQDYREAKRQWTLLHDLNPGYPLVESYLEKAHAEIDKARNRKKAEEKAQQVFKQANAEYIGNNLPEARMLLDSVLALMPTHSAALSLVARIRGEIQQQQDAAFLKGMALYEQGNYPHALEKWQEALLLDSSNSQLSGHIDETKRHIDEIKKLHRAEAEKYQAAKQIKRAIREYENLLRLSPDDAAAKTALTSLRAAYASQVKHRYEKAVALFKNDKYHEATSLFEQVLITDPSHASAKQYLAQCQKHIDAQQKKEQVAALRQNAEKLQQDSQFKNAAEIWQQIISLDSLNTHARHQLSICRNKAQAQKANLAAQDMFRRSIQQYQKGRIRAARNMWKQILARNPQNETVLQMLKKVDAEAASQIGRAKKYAKQKKWDMAITAYKRALQLSPGNRTAQAGLADAQTKMAQQKQLAAAQPSDKPSTKTDPAKINELFNKGLDFYMQKKFDKALAEWNVVLKLDPQNQRALTYIKNLKNKLERLKQL